MIWYETSRGYLFLFLRVIFIEMDLFKIILLCALSIILIFISVFSLLNLLNVSIQIRIIIGSVLSLIIGIIVFLLLKKRMAA